MNQKPPAIMEDIYNKAKTIIDRHNLNQPISEAMLVNLRKSIDKQLTSEPSADYKYWISLWNQYAPNVRLTEKKRGQIRARLQTFSPEEIESAIIGRFNDEWTNGPGKKYRDNWDAIWRSDDKMEYWLIKSQNHPSQKHGEDNQVDKDTTHPLQKWILDEGLRHLTFLEWLTPEECDTLVRNHGKDAVKQACRDAHFTSQSGESAYEAISICAEEVAYV